MEHTDKKFVFWVNLLLAVLVVGMLRPLPVAAQDQGQYSDQDQNRDQDDPPSRVARLGYMEGSVSFQPAGESEWVSAVPNRPMTTGDKLWADQNSRAEVQLGSAVIRLSANTGISFLNLDDRTVQVQLSSGSVNVRLQRLDRDENFEIDTPNLAFSALAPGRYRVDASEDGNYTVVNLRDGEGEATGNGQTYKLHPGQRGTFNGTDSLNADIVQVGGPDAFDSWADNRDRRAEESQSARYVSHDVVGYEDLDEYGDWRDDASYGHVWYPNRVSAGWAPYHDGHWAWISPWGWTWVDDAPWGYAPFHYGRWVSVRGRWGWIAGPVTVRPVYAPALVVFVGGRGPAMGGNVAWFPLGPREVFVPSYHVSRGYVNRVNVSNTTVNTTTVTNVYNTTIINKTTNVTNVTYVNRNVNGAVTAVPQRAFTSAQPVARSSVRMTAREIASAPVSARVEVAPTQSSVLGVHANTANRVAAPPAAVAARPVIAKATPPPPPVSFAKQQQALDAHPGQPLARQQLQSLRPANAPAAQPQVRQAPPGKPATPNMGRPGNQPNQPANAVPPNQPGNRPGGQPAPNERPGANPATPGRPATNNQPAPNARPSETPGGNAQPPAAQPGNRPAGNQPVPNARPEPNRPQPNQPQPNQPQPNQPAPNRPAEAPANNRPPAAAQPNNRPDATQPAPNGRPEPNRPQPNQPAPSNRPGANQPTPNARPDGNRPQPNPSAPNNRPEANQPAPNARPEGNRPQPNAPAGNRPSEQPAQNNRPPAAQPNNRPDTNRPAEQPQRNQPTPRPQNTAPNDRPQQQQRTPPPSAARPGNPPPQRPLTPEEKKRQEEQRKRDEKPHN
jgi:hypothetical protein